MLSRFLESSLALSISLLFIAWAMGNNSPEKKVSGLGSLFDILRPPDTALNEHKIATRIK